VLALRSSSTPAASQKKYFDKIFKLTQHALVPEFALMDFKACLKYGFDEHRQPYHEEHRRAAANGIKRAMLDALRVGAVARDDMQASALLGSDYEAARVPMNLVYLRD